MRLAIFSDIHGNDFAFEIVEADIEKQNIDQLVCLGDAIQGGPQPKQTVDRLRRLNCPVVMGNADAWMLSGIETADEGIPPERRKKMEEIRQWSLSQLSDDDCAFISSFQPTITIPLDGNLKLLCFHGSPTSFDDVIQPDAPMEIFQKYLGAHTDKILTGGHTHAQQIRRTGDLFFFNPGSIGLAFSRFHSDGNTPFDPWAEYAILTVENGQVNLEFRRLPFEANDLIRVYRESGRPYGDEAAEQYKK